MSDLQTLLDKSALYELIARYCRCMDRRDFTQARTLFHDDAIIERVAIFSGTADEYIAWISKVTPQFELTVHRIFNTLFVVDGDQAEGEIYLEAYHRTKGPEAREATVGGRYLDRFERRNGLWKFRYRTSTADRCEVRMVNPQDYEQFVAGSVAGRPDRQDVSYAKLPLFARAGL
jgi:SnoaL-like domain